MKDAFINTLTTIAKADRRVMLLTGDLGFGMVERFVAACPKQFLNAGVAEQNMIGLATGLALKGRIVFAYSIANFSTLRCLEQIRNDALYHDANVKVVAMGGGFSYGALGMSHHATEDLAILRVLPKLTCVAPGDDWEAGEATAALATRPGTAYLRLDKMSAGDTRRPSERFEIGRARTLRDGDDVSILVSGGILKVALEASDALRARGIQARVVHFASLKPLDEAAILAAARETGGVLTLEEHSVLGGLGGAVAETLLEGGVSPKAFRRLGLRDTFATVVGSQSYLQKYYGMDQAAVVSAVLDVIGVPAMKPTVEEKHVPAH